MSIQRKFAFGENWKRYLALTSEKEIEEARLSLLQYLPAEEYKEKVFFDIGCGSGLFSFAALLLGCKKVYSFDVDKESVEATQALRNKFSYLLEGKQFEWLIEQGDILSDDFIARFSKTGDIVYSWGVLHHTGDMWRAIENAGKIVKKDGHLIIAIYNKALTSWAWRFFKQVYNALPSFGKLFFAALFMPIAAFKRILSGRHPFKEKRGMFVFTDIIDWFGGYPYEFASFQEVCDFLEERQFLLLKVPIRVPFFKELSFIENTRLLFGGGGTAANEFVFKRK